ncbi:hypothetical protein HQ487_05160 [Candidatus Uhrbacteria bacterium]|nr:hypothetical protein [Candidatus Uhrbacteria bacterium]
MSEAQRRFLGSCRSSSWLPFSATWPRIEPHLSGIMRAAAEVVFQSGHEVKGIQPVIAKLVKAEVLHKEGPYVTAVLALMVSMRGEKDLFYYKDREARDLRLIAPWVAKRWRRGGRYQEGQIDQVHHKLVKLMAEHFPHGKREMWSIDPLPEAEAAFERTLQTVTM